MTPGPDGVRYFGCLGGILEFDGATWRHLPLPVGAVRALVFGPDGRLYVSAATDVGEFITDLDGGMFDRKLSIALSQVAAAAVDNDKAGEVTVKFSFAKIAGTTRHQGVVAKVQAVRAPPMAAR